ncbi:MAG: hypothetical protein Q7S34_00610 [bacterium]|nr:hypothetical protein [bacterium]
MDNLNNISGNNLQNNGIGTQGGGPIRTPVTPPPMENNQQNNSGNENNSSIGPIIGSIIVVLVIVLGGLYIYGQRLSDQSKQEVPVENISASADQSTTKLEQQGSTDSLSEINADLNATDLNGLDAESMQIDQELKVQ